jgi:hypothetical protein
MVEMGGLSSGLKIAEVSENQWVTKGRTKVTE